MSYREGNDKVPCKMACPAGIDIPRYVRLVSQGKFDKALAVIREKIPFPLVCGYVCPKPCETACVAGKLGESVGIKELKRFAAQHGQDKQSPPTPPYSDKHVAIVGSGPAGLTAAYFLAKKGHHVTLFEKERRPGGMLWLGIPNFILPKDILRKEIDYILRFEGIELKLNKPINTVTQLLQDDYDAVFVASGACEARKLPIPGNDLEGVFLGLNFLRQVNSGEDLKLGKRILVLGGGGVACDVARTALRLGCPTVQMACLESRQAMPASPWELDLAEQEGVTVFPSRTFIKMIAQGRQVTGVECLKLRWAKFDAEGALHLEPVEGSEHILEADTVIFATGQSASPAIVSETPKIQITRKGNIIVDSETLQTAEERVFAGGDVVTGPVSVIEAIAAGRRAAISIDRFMGGDGNIGAITECEEEVDMRGGMISFDERTEIPILPMEKRPFSFDGINLGWTEKQAIAEANRCLRCDLPIFTDETKCVGCNTCAIWCSFALNNAFNPMNGKIRIVPPDRGPEFAKSEIGFTDGCDGCGICVSRCFYGALLRGKTKTCQVNRGD